MTSKNKKSDDFLTKAQYEKEHDGIKKQVSKSLKEDDCIKFGSLFEKTCNEASNKIDEAINKIFVKSIKSNDSLKEALIGFLNSEKAKSQVNEIIKQYDKNYAQSLLKRWWLFLYTPFAIAIYKLIEVGIEKLFK